MRAGTVSSTAVRASGRYDAGYWLETFVDEEPTEETRYGLYELGERPPGSGELAPVRVAETCKEGIGVALVRLAEDRAAAGDTEIPIVGVLDQIDRRWISGLWPRSS